VATASTGAVRGNRVLRSVGETVEYVGSTLMLSDAEIATALGVALRTVDRWRRGVAVPQRDARERLGTLVALGEHVREMFDGDAAAEWLGAENRYLGGLTPLEAIRAGRPDRVEAALEAIESGIFL
jgi:transcriptional regulator with XRE-family HTH domain